ncbi:unnamed protein product [Schistosoma turkestanicum]|nr:unnamed protein product [Schistosoma turkestanicum]
MKRPDSVVLFLNNPEEQRQGVNKANANEEDGNAEFSGELDMISTEKKSAINHSSKSIVNESKLEGRLLTRDDLINLDKNEPHWKYIRIGTLIAFATVFFGLLAACIAYMSFGQQCPSVPTLPFWKSSVGYWLDVFAFKDSSGDLVGDLKGLISEVDYIKSVIGAGFVILGPITKGFYTSPYNMLGLVEDYEQLDEAVGTMEDFRVLLKTFHKKGVKVVVTFNFNAISINHKWMKEKKVKLQSFKDPYNNKISRYGKAIDVDIDGKKYYSVFGSPNVDLDLTDPGTQRQIFNVIDVWMKEGIDGILLDKAAFFVEEEENVQRKLNSKWSENCPNSQLYRNGSVAFVKAVKQAMINWIKKSGKDKLLAVNSGDTGCGVNTNPDPMLMFRDAADLIISREFVFQRGESGRHMTFATTNIEKFSSYSDSDKENLILTTSTSNTPTYSNIVELASTLLLPGI